jgi:hypothetical protein
MATITNMATTAKAIRVRNQCGRNSSTNTAVTSVVITFTTFTSLATFTIGAAVATHAVVQIADSLVAVFPQNVLHRVFMAAIAGVAAVIIVDVASGALHVVILVQYE